MKPEEDDEEREKEAKIPLPRWCAIVVFRLFLSIAIRRIRCSQLNIVVIIVIIIDVVAVICVRNRRVQRALGRGSSSRTERRVEESEGEGLMLPLANVLQEEVSAKASWHLDGP